MTTTAEQLIAISLIVQGAGAVIAAVGVILVALVKRKVAQVENTVIQVERKSEAVVAGVAKVSDNLVQVAQQGDKTSATLAQVEKQGNSVSLELKRTNMVYAENLAAATPANEGNQDIAKTARTAYEEAVKANDKL